jgi:RNA polymerase subunit RPABC4/transcription elongation factor Spt4
MTKIVKNIRCPKCKALVVWDDQPCAWCGSPLPPVK